ncbi:MAG: ATPase, T2SS/T4P/T4SS family [Candidatus Gracilibacteria bacterium]|nr:ATPase, T2SS/T4P/T4SS family [Candidatus Gracilibacteria bacterium]
MYKTSEIDDIKIRKDLGDTINYIDKIFIEAIEIEASDIHIEPLKDSLLIRFRIDGDFKIYDNIDRENISAIITRLKVLAKVKIDENKKPQDGKIVFIMKKKIGI